LKSFHHDGVSERARRTSPLYPSARRARIDPPVFSAKIFAFYLADARSNLSGTRGGGAIVAPFTAASYSDQLLSWFRQRRFGDTCKQRGYQRKRFCFRFFFCKSQSSNDESSSIVTSTSTSTYVTTSRVASILFFNRVVSDWRGTPMPRVASRADNVPLTRCLASG